MASDQPPPTKPRKIPNGILPATIQHFSTLPLAQPTFSDPSFSIYPSSRTVERIGNERHHTLMAQTWNTPDTIPHMLTFLKTSTTTSTAAAAPHSASVDVEIRRFYTFGSGLNAHADRLHGGVLAAIVDSTLSNLAFVGVQRVSRDDRVTVATMQLNVAYKAPVDTPGSVMVTARVKRVEGGGRKVWVEGSVRGGEDGKIVHATAEGMWLRIKVVEGKL